jgi:hypothetical protein
MLDNSIISMMQNQQFKRARQAEDEDRSEKRQQTVRRAVSGRVTSIVKLLSNDLLIAGLAELKAELKLSPDYVEEDYGNYIAKQHKRVWQALSTLGYTEEADGELLGRLKAAEAEVASLKQKNSRLEQKIVDLSAVAFAKKPIQEVEKAMVAYFDHKLTSSHEAYFSKVQPEERAESRKALSLHVLEGIEEVIASKVTSRHNESDTANLKRRTLARQALQDACLILEQGNAINSLEFGKSACKEMLADLYHAFRPAKINELIDLHQNCNLGTLTFFSKLQRPFNDRWGHLLFKKKSIISSKDRTSKQRRLEEAAADRLFGKGSCSKDSCSLNFEGFLTAFIWRNFAPEFNDRIFIDEDNTINIVIDIDVTNDGSEASKNNYSLMGFKLFFRYTDRNLKIHSVHVCIPMMCFIGKDTIGAVQEHFNPMYAYIEHIKHDCNSIIEIHGIKFPCAFRYPSDKKNIAQMRGVTSTGATQLANGSVDNLRPTKETRLAVNYLLCENCKKNKEAGLLLVEECRHSVKRSVRGEAPTAGEHLCLTPLIKSDIWNPLGMPFNKKIPKPEALIGEDRDNTDEEPIAVESDSDQWKTLARLLTYDPNITQPAAINSDVAAKNIVKNWTQKNQIHLTGTDEVTSLKMCDAARLKVNLVLRWGLHEKGQYTWQKSLTRATDFLEKDINLGFTPSMTQTEKMRIVLFWTMTAEAYLRNFAYFRLYHAKHSVIIKFWDDIALCTLHLEDRVSKTLVQLTMQCVLDDNIDAVPIRHAKIADVTKLINTDILRKVSEGDNPTNVKVSIEDKKVGRVGVWCGATRKIMAESGRIIGMTLPVRHKEVDDEVVEYYSHPKYDPKNHIKLYELWNTITTRIRSDIDFSDDDINAWQMVVDDFGRLFLLMYGWRAAGDYIQSLIEGRFRDHLEIHRNLHRHCQQAWEAVNKLVNKYLNTQTNKGGNKGGGLKDNACHALYRWMKRRGVRIIFPTLEDLEAYINDAPQQVAAVAADVVYDDDEEEDDIDEDEDDEDEDAEEEGQRMDVV